MTAAVIRYFNTTLDELKRSRTRPSRARQTLIYLLRKYMALTNREIGAMVGMRFSAVSKAGLQIVQLMAVDKKINRDVKKIISNFEG
ncbi:MAG TPA: helix-turn-helix domain-containing protein [bacterium]